MTIRDTIIVAAARVWLPAVAAAFARRFHPLTSGRGNVAPNGG